MTNDIVIYSTDDRADASDVVDKIHDLSNLLDPVSLYNIKQAIGMPPYSADAGIYYTKEEINDGMRIQDSADQTYFSVMLPNIVPFRMAKNVINLMCMDLQSFFPEEEPRSGAIEAYISTIDEFVFKLVNAKDEQDIYETIMEAQQ